MRKTTAERGYGTDHRRLRERLVAALDSDAPCPRCGDALGGDPTVLDLDHTDDRSGYLGLTHRCCNRSYGRSRWARRRTVRADRTCEYCCATYSPSYSDQR